MKICEFRYSALRPIKHKGVYSVLPSPAAYAMRILLRALETINQAGLDGKRLTNLEVRAHNTPHDFDDPIEIHADVKHRLAKEAGK